MGVIVGVGHADLLVGAAGAGEFTTVDAGVVEVGVEGAEVATAAEPQSRHRDIGRRWLTGGMVGSWVGLPVDISVEIR